MQWSYIVRQLGEASARGRRKLLSIVLHVPILLQSRWPNSDLGQGGSRQ